MKNIPLPDPVYKTLPDRPRRSYWRYRRNLPPIGTDDYRVGHAIGLGPLFSRILAIQSIASLPLDPRVLSALRRRGVAHVGDLIGLSKDDLLASSDLGPQRVKHIEKVLAARNLSLADRRPR